MNTPAPVPKRRRTPMQGLMSLVTMGLAIVGGKYAYQYITDTGAFALTQNEQLVRAAKQLNAQLPIDHGNGVRTTRVWVNGNEFHYLKVLEGDASTLTAAEIEDAQREDQNLIISSVCKNSDMVKAMSTGVTYHWHIADVTGFVAYELRMDNKTCPLSRNVHDANYKL